MSDPHLNNLQYLRILRPVHDYLWNDIIFSSSFTSFVFNLHTYFSCITADRPISSSVVIYICLFFQPGKALIIDRQTSGIDIDIIIIIRNLCSGQCYFNGTCIHIHIADFGRLTYTQAVELLEHAKDKFQYPVYWGCDLQTEHERYLTEQLFKKPVFVTDYPKEIKAFYMRINDDNKTVAAADLLVPGIGEIIGGSQREERYDVLLNRIRELGLNEEDYSWYLDLRKYGGTKHAGYGLGFERLIMYITGVSNIRDVLPFPRTTGSAEF